MAQANTVSTYLLTRLKELGIDHLFGVPGDYVLDFLDEVVVSPVKWVGTCNELNAGYAADGYARLKGIGGAVVTYCVGGFSILNAVAGAYAEGVPLVIVSGAPPTTKRSAGALVHHLVADYNRQLDIFRKVTVDAALLDDPASAPAHIDRVLCSCVENHLPVYIELPANLAKAPCPPPAEPLSFSKPSFDAESLRDCLEDIARMMNGAKNPAVLVGIEVLRHELGSDVLKLVESVELPYATMPSSKCVLPELHPQFIGVYRGEWSREEVRRQVEGSDCLLSLGVWMTDFDTGGFTVELERRNVISVLDDTVRIGSRYYEHVDMAELIRQLLPMLSVRSYLEAHPAAPYASPEPFVPEKNAALTASRFYGALQGFLDDSMILLSEPGDSFAASPDFNMQEPENYIVQNYYSSIGFCTPASLGVALARPEKRPVVLTGDGAFQMTAQEISTLMRCACAPVFILINNDGYLIERMLHDDGPYNDIQMWKYAQLPGVFSTKGEGVGCQVRTEEELQQALQLASSTPDKMVFIEVCLGKLDCSENLRRLGESMHNCK